MNNETRAKLWCVITELGKDIERRISSSGSAKFDETVKNNFFDLYDKYRETLKVEFMREDTSRIDRHKIAACVVMAIIKSIPIKNIDKTLQAKQMLYYLANEALAVFSALYILKLFLLENDSDTITDYEKDKIKQDGFIFPDNDDKDYILWLLSVLTKCAESNTDGVNIMLLANIFFFVEKYTLQSYKIP